MTTRNELGVGVFGPRKSAGLNVAKERKKERKKAGDMCA